MGRIHLLVGPVLVPERLVVGALGLFLGLLLALVVKVLLLAMLRLALLLGCVRVCPQILGRLLACRTHIRLQRSVIHVHVLPVRRLLLVRGVIPAPVRHAYLGYFFVIVVHEPLELLARVLVSDGPAQVWADLVAQFGVGLHLSRPMQLRRDCLLGLLLVLDQYGVYCHPLFVGESHSHRRLCLGAMVFRHRRP